MASGAIYLFPGLRRERNSLLNLQYLIVTDIVFSNVAAANVPPPPPAHLSSSHLPLLPWRVPEGGGNTAPNTAE